MGVLVAGGVGIDADGVEHPDNTLRFARYAEAVARLVAVDPNFAVDIVHLHDWPAAAAAALLRALQWRGRSVLTIHNLAFQCTTCCCITGVADLHPISVLLLQG